MKGNGTIFKVINCKSTFRKAGPIGFISSPTLCLQPWLWCPSKEPKVALQRNWMMPLKMDLSVSDEGLKEKQV